MTVSTSTSFASYAGNGSLTTFAYAFKIFEDSDLLVTLVNDTTGVETTQTLTTNYTVTGAGNDAGGNVVFVTAPASGVTIKIRRVLPVTQETDYVPNDPFPAEAHEDALDKLTMLVQQANVGSDLAISFPEGDVGEGSNNILPSAVDRAGKVFAFDSSGGVAITQEIGEFKGNWSASTSYAVRDLVKDTSTNNIFLANTAHTSSGSQPITTNADSAKWDLIVDAASATSSASAAASSATDAETAQTAAETAQTAAETAQTAAETAETNAETAQTAAETAETNAETAQTAAEAAQAAAELAYDNFDDRYLGAKSTSGGDPTVDNDGDALIDGALFFDTTNNVMKVYNLGTTTWLRTTPTTADQANIDTVSGIQANVTTVAGISSDVTSVAGVSASVTTLAGLTSEITAVANVDTELEAVSAKITEVQTVADDLNESISEIETVANDLTSGNFVAGSEYDFGSITTATSGTSGSPDGFIVTVFNNLSDITSVANIDSDVTTVAGIAANVTSVAGVSSDVSVVAANVADVTNFADVYYGPNATAPTLRQDGSALQAGDLYFNTTSDLINVWDGSQWQAAVASLSGALVATNNLSDLTNTATARTNLGLGSAATAATSDFAAASHTHTLSDITDAGTMASQDANNVNITGGVIDGGSIA